MDPRPRSSHNPEKLDQPSGRLHSGPHGATSYAAKSEKLGKSRLAAKLEGPTFSRGTEQWGGQVADQSAGFGQKFGSPVAPESAAFVHTRPQESREIATRSGEVPLCCRTLWQDQQETALSRQKT